MENDSEFEHVKMKGHRNSVVALATKLYPPESFEEENKALNFGLSKFNLDLI